MAIRSSSTQQPASARKHNLCFSRVAMCSASLHVLWSHAAFHVCESGCVLFETLHLLCLVWNTSPFIVGKYTQQRRCDWYEGIQWYIQFFLGGGAKLSPHVGSVVSTEGLCIRAWRKLGQFRVKEIIFNPSDTHQTLVALHYQNILQIF
jgi:hypothetical protein